LVSNHRMYNTTSKLNFDFDKYKHEMMRFKLPNQEFSFTLTELKTSDDPVMAVAFRRAFRISVIPSLNVYGNFAAKQRIYLDSAILHDYLQTALESADVDEKHGLEEHKHVTIFLISIYSSHPILLINTFRPKLYLTWY